MIETKQGTRSRNVWVAIIVGLFLSQAVLWAIAIRAVADEPPVQTQGRR